jgi:translocator protein
MKNKRSYIIIPLLVIAVGSIGSIFTTAGMGWYATITLPQGTPPGSIIGTVRTIIYACCIASLFLFWKTKHDKRFTLILRLFIINGLINTFWNRFFFVQHRLLFSFIVMIILRIITIIKIILLYPRSKRASLLLILYPIWVAIASWFAYHIRILNS